VIAVVGSARNEATVGVVSAWQALGLDAELIAGSELGLRVRTEDVVLGRLDVLPTLDGVEPGLLALWQAEQRSIDVLNCAETLLTVHDKLRTATLLAATALPHPRTIHIRDVGADSPVFDGPYVVKPRFGKWGQAVTRCEDATSLLQHLRTLRGRAWFRRHGALVQEGLPSVGYDIRIIVAGGRVVGAGLRRAGQGERRANVSRGGSFSAIELDDGLAELARAAVAVVGGDFGGVDLLPMTDGRVVVLELNGAVELEDVSAIGGRTVAEAAAQALGLHGSRRVVRDLAGSAATRR
jgi:RimK family alpha-L-glutamate ligase